MLQPYLWRPASDYCTGHQTFERWWGGTFHIESITVTFRSPLADLILESKVVSRNFLSGKFFFGRKSFTVEFELWEQSFRATTHECRAHSGCQKDTGILPDRRERNGQARQCHFTAPRGIIDVDSDHQWTNTLDERLMSNLTMEGSSCHYRQWQSILMSLKVGHCVSSDVNAMSRVQANHEGFLPKMPSTAESTSVFRV